MNDRKLRLIRVLALMLALSPNVVHAQVPNTVGVRANTWVLSSGSLGFDEDYSGLGGAVGHSWSHASARASMAYVREDDVKPGWVTLTAEVEPKVAVSALEFGGRFGVGGHHMRNEGRRQAAEACRSSPTCFFEAEAYNPGWSGLTEAGAVLGVRVQNFRVSVSAGRVRLFGGANAGVAMGKAELQVEYVWR